MKVLSNILRLLLSLCLATTSCSYSMAPDQELINAAHDNNIEHVREVLAQNAQVNLNSTDKEWKGYKRTALYYACLHNNQELITLLLDHGADINFRNSGGETCLHTVMSGDHIIGTKGIDQLALAMILLKRGIDVNVRDNEGETALYRAAKLGVSDDVVKILIEYGADVNQASNSGRIPYYYTLEPYFRTQEVKRLLMPSLKALVVQYIRKHQDQFKDIASLFKSYTLYHY